MADLRETLRLDTSPSLRAIQALGRQIDDLLSDAELDLTAEITNLAAVQGQIARLGADGLKLAVDLDTLGAQGEIDQLDDDKVNLAVELADADLDAFVTEVTAVDGSIIELTAAVSDADFDSFAASIAALDNSVIDLTTAISDADFDAFASNVAALDGSVIDLTVAVDDSGLDSVADGLDGVQASALGLPAFLSPQALGITAAVGGFGLLIDSASDFDRGIREVATLDATDLGITEATDIINELVAQTGLASDEAIPALYSAISAGIPTENAFEFLLSTTELASAGVAELQPTVSVLTGAINAYGESLGGPADASNALFAAVQTGVTTLPELASQLGNVTPLAADLGISFIDLNAAVAASTQVTQNTATSVTGLRSLLAELGTSTSKAGKAFDEISGGSLRDFIAGGGDLAGALDLLVEQADNTGVGLNELFGSVEAGGIALQLSREDGEAFASTLESVSAAVEEGTAVSSAFALNQENFGATLGRLRNQIGLLLVDLVSGLLPSLTLLLQLTIDNLPAIVAFTGTIFEFGKSVAGVAVSIFEAVQAAGGFLDQLGILDPVIAGIGIAVSLLAGNAGLGALGAILASTVLPALGTFAAFLVGTLAPALAIAAAIVAVSIAANEAAQFFGGWGQIASDLSDLFTGTLLPALEKVLDVVVDEFGPAFETLLDLFSSVADFVVALFTGQWSDAWDSFLSIVGNSVELVIDLLAGLAGLAARALRRFGPVALRAIGRGLAGLGRIVGSALLAGLVALTRWVGDMLAAALPFGFRLVVAIVAGLPGLAALIGGFLGDALVVLGRWVASMLGAAAGFAADFISGIDFSGLASSIGGWLGDALLTVGAWAVQLAISAGAAAAGFLTSFNLFNLVPLVVGWLADVLLAVGSWILQLTAASLSAAASFVSGFDLSGLATTVAGWLGDVLAAIATWAIALIASASQAAQGWLTGFDLSTFVSNVVGWLVGVVAAIDAWATALVVSAVTAAVGFVTGFDLSGLVASVVGWLTDTATAIALWALDIGAQALNAATVFAESFDLSAIAANVVVWLAETALAVGLWAIDLAATGAQAATDFVASIDFSALAVNVAVWLAETLLAIVLWAADAAATAFQFGIDFVEAVDLSGLAVAVAIFLANALFEINGFFADALLAALGWSAQFVIDMLSAFPGIAADVAIFLAGVLLEVDLWVLRTLASAAGFATDFVITILSGLAGLPGDVAGLLGDVALSFGSFFVGVLADALGFVADMTAAFASLGTSIGAGLRSGINSVIGALNSFVIPGFTIPVPGPTPDITVGSIDPFSIPFLAKGAVLDQPTLFVGGEAGTEVVAPMGDMSRTLALISQAGYLPDLVDALLSAGEFDRIMGREFGYLADTAIGHGQAAGVYAAAAPVLVRPEIVVLPAPVVVAGKPGPRAGGPGEPRSLRKDRVRSRRHRDGKL